MTSTLLPTVKFEYDESQDEIEFELLGWPAYRQIEPAGHGFHKIIMESIEAKEKKVCLKLLFNT
jgi:hypothetical protein